MRSLYNQSGCLSLNDVTALDNAAGDDVCSYPGAEGHVSLPPSRLLITTITTRCHGRQSELILSALSMSSSSRQQDLGKQLAVLAMHTASRFSCVCECVCVRHDYYLACTIKLLQKLFLFLTPIGVNHRGSPTVHHDVQNMHKYRVLRGEQNNYTFFYNLYAQKPFA